MTDYAERAGDMYLRHFNCAQALLHAFGDRTGLDADTSLRLASAFGGGMGSLKDVCGALTGAFMVLGLAKGFTDPVPDNTRDLTKRVDRLIEAFQKRFGDTHCRALLRRNAAIGGEQTGVRPCLRYVRGTAEMLAGQLDQ